MACISLNTPESASGDQRFPAVAAEEEDRCSSCRRHPRLLSGRTVMSQTARGRDIGKPDDAYTRRQKKLLAFNNFWDKNCDITLRSNNGGISKSPANSRSALTQAETTSHSESNNSEISISKSSSPGGYHVISTARREVCPWRSFSLSDLQRTTAAGGDYGSITKTNKANYTDALHFRVTLIIESQIDVH
ncbi:Hypothetical predicted protein [Olea europaea subsp. europaea]|uniref:Uncharacterized protein n=1 Tax=Olea europaea subsp. europaea TaxID=158383 RepID=A0A8S0R2J6_OLEEU|nr:Hypothetical predicted protein [Olea europaea subsp. europaea]